MRYTYDLIVIGSGAGGTVGARHAASLGKRVAIIEKGIVGGECPNFGCVPTKALLQAAHTLSIVKSASQFGIKTRSGSFDHKIVRKWKNETVLRTGTSHGEASLKKHNIDLIKGTAKFVSPHEIAVGPRTFSSDKFLIATGSRPVIPPIEGLNEAGYLTFEGAVEFDRIPKSLFIIGGGPIGCEFAQIYATFGSRIYIADMQPRLLAKEDKEVGELVQGLFEHKGITVLPQSTITGVKKQSEKRLVTYQSGSQSHTVTVEKILVAAGKQPNIDLDLEQARIVYDKRGIAVNPYLQTTAPHIFAAGDVTGPHLFTHTGEYQSYIAAHNAFSYKKLKADYRVIPRCVFLEPEVASVGITEAQAHENKIRIRKGIIPVSVLGRANTTNQFDGFVKVITDPSGTLIGGAIVGPRAGEVVHELALAIKLKAKAEDIAEMIHAYPTFSEALKLACSNLE